VAAKKLTPAQAAKQKRLKAVQTPPARIVSPNVSLVDLELTLFGVRYPIGRNIEGDTPWSMALDETGQITIPIRSPDHSLELLLIDRQLRQEVGIRLEIDDVTYVLQTVDTDETGLYTLLFEDEVSWRLKQFTSLIHADRKTITRAGFVLRMVHEASNPPLAPMQTFIPEAYQRQAIEQS
jgi:hypothetical protein